MGRGGTFCRYHRQYCTQHAAYLISTLSSCMVFILLHRYATTMQ